MCAHGLRRARYDALIVGSGPNGLAAAITLARHGLSTAVLEARETLGGGMRSHALTLPGFIHDACAAVHPLGFASPLFRTLDLERGGLRWVQSPLPAAHVMADGRAIALSRSIAETAEQLGRDARAYARLMEPLVSRFDQLVQMILGPLRAPAHPALMARFGLDAVLSMRGLARKRFRDDPAAALLSGLAAHAMLPLDTPPTASFALVLAMSGHAVGWPVVRGGSQALADALVARYLALGGEVRTCAPVSSLDALPPARAYLLDVSPRALIEIAGDRLPRPYVRELRRYRFGPGIFKADWALDRPIAWRDERCRRAVTIHLSGKLADVAAAEAAVHAGVLPDRPFVLLAQPTIVDPTRAPPGKHTAWAYCHVPHGSSADRLRAIEDHIERHAPGFRDSILGCATRNAVQTEQYDPNFVGGDISGGLSNLRQMFFRPTVRLDPYATDAPGVYLCSSSTPPGGGVHGMCGYWAARSALERTFDIGAVDLTRTRPAW
jgi:phytoene dehydrogenase-like protein